MPSPLVQRASLGIVVLASAASWTVRQTGGFDLELLGLTITVHRTGRLDAAIAVAAATFFISGGRLPLRLIGRLGWLVPDPVHLAAALALAVLVVGLWFGSPAVGGSDSYGYLSQAHLWMAGGVSQPQPWAAHVPWPFGPQSFTPLGYGVGPDGTSLVPIYAAGLPLLLALAMFIGGPCAAFVVVPACGAGLVLTTFALGRALSSPWVGLVAAWLVATSPVLLYMLMSPMSDIPVATAWTLVFLWVSGSSRGSAVGAGLASGLSVMLRLNMAPLVLLPLAWLIWQARTATPPAPSSARSRLAWFVAALLPGVIAVAAINASLYGSPLRNGYGDTSGFFALANVLPNMRNYSAWLTDVHTPFIWLGVVALLVPARRLWCGVAGSFAPWGAAFLAALWMFYCLYGEFGVWWYLRFLLPGLPLVAVGLGAVVRAAALYRGPIVVGLLAVGVFALGVSGVREAQRRLAFEQRSDTKYISAANMVSAATERSAIIISKQHSGSLRHYAGRMTLQFDNLDPQWLDDAVEWMGRRGVSVYALLEKWEVDEWRQRFGSQNELGRLEMAPIRRIDGGPGIALYDLGSPAKAAGTVGVAAAANQHCQAPVPLGSPPPF